jgi:hypothetical protein
MGYLVSDTAAAGDETGLKLFSDSSVRAISVVT